MGLKLLLLLLKLKLNILINGFTKGASKKRTRKIFALVGGGFIFFFIYKWIFEIFSTLGDNPQIGSLLMEGSLAIIFLGFFIFLLASGITISIHYLFISSDLPLLMTSPISSQTIFSFKLIEAVFANSTFFFFLGFPTFIAFGLMNHAGWFYYPLIVITALCFLTIPISISFLGALLIVRVIPPARAKEFMGILLGIVSLGIWLLLQIVRASQFDRSSPDFNPQSLERLQHISHASWLDALPSTWAAKSLAGFAHWDGQLILFNFLPLLLLTGFVFFACISLSKTAFKNGLIGSADSVTVKRRNRAKAKSEKKSSITDMLFSGPTGAVMLRDFKLYTRDSRQLVNLFMFAAMMIIIPLIQRQDDAAELEFMMYQPYFFIFLFNTVISAQISSRLIPLEAGSFWLTKLLPQSPARLLSGKFFIGFLFNTLLSWAAVITISVYFHHPIRLTILAMMATLSISGAMSGIGIFFGMTFANFTWDHPKRMLSASGGILLSISSLVSLAIIGGFSVGVFLAGKALDISQSILEFFAVGTVFILAVIFAVTALILSSKKFNRMEWVI